MYKYRAVFDKVDKHKIEKETDKQVVYIGTNGHAYKEAKLSSWYSWHNTFEEAKLFLIKTKIADINQIKDQLEYENEQLDKLQKLTEV